MLSPRGCASCWRLGFSEAIVCIAIVAAFAFPQPLAGQRARPSSPSVALSDADIATWARLLAMTDARAVADAVIDAALASESSPLRAAGALSIGQVRARAHAPRLIALLSDADTVVAANAAYALGLLRDTSNARALAMAVREAPVAVAVEAAWALGELGAAARPMIDSMLVAIAAPPPPPVPVSVPRASAKAAMQPPVEKAAPAPSPVSSRVTEALLLSSAKMRPVPVATVSPFLRSREPGVAWRAAYALSRVPSPAGVRALADQVLNPSLDVRANVARGLAKTAAGDTLAALARRSLDLLVESRDPHVRINAIRSLATYGAPARLAVVAATRDTNPNVRIAAALTLASVMDRDLVRWSWLWQSDTAFAYRKAVLDASMRTGVELPALREWRLSDDWRRRAALASAARVAPSADRGIEISLPLTREVDPRVRAAGYSALGQRIDSVPAIADSIKRGLMDRDPVVRAAAIRALSRRANVADAAYIATVYRRSVADTVNDAQVAAISYLSAAWRRDSASFTDSLRAAVAALPQPPDPEVTAAARGASVFTTWSSALPVVRPIAWYEEIVRRLIVPGLSGSRPSVELRTARGTITLELFPVDAPLTVNNFLSLAGAGYYGNTRFHRVVPNFVVQDGDPRGDGSGGPGYAIRDELNRNRYERGVLGMALSGPDTGGSQYFITHSAQPHLDGGYTVFGRVTRGFTALDSIVEGDGLIEVRIR
jgi:cyclophilin family peptidyl-prolyl cis-trans isomerase/HEAT repeat protein